MAKGLPLSSSDHKVPVGLDDSVGGASRTGDQGSMVSSPSNPATLFRGD